MFGFQAACHIAVSYGWLVCACCYGVFGAPEIIDDIFGIILGWWSIESFKRKKREAKAKKKKKVVS